MTESIGTNWAWVIPALSAGAFFVVFPFRRRLPLQGAPLSIAAILVGFALFWFVLADLLTSGSANFSIRWLSVGETTLTWGVTVDRISVTMLGLVTFVALLVQVYSLGYMKHDGKYDPGLGRYYAVHSLFVAAMLALVLADNLVFLYITWELVGLGSYLLIGFWYERRSAGGSGEEGVYHDANRRRGPADRDSHAVQGHRDVRHLHPDTHRAERRHRSGHAKRGDASDISWGDGKVSAGAVPRVASRRHGRPDAGERADPRGDHGCRWRLSRCPHDADVRADPRRCSSSSRPWAS